MASSSDFASNRGQQQEQGASTVTVSPSSVRDLPATTDALGFSPYVKALAAFLTHSDTQPPITLSIEGAWGSGKSSFMRLLKELLSNAGAKTVWFNAWRHNKDEELWAAFAVDFTNDLAKTLPAWKRSYLHFRLSVDRFDWRKGWFHLAKAVVLTGLFLYLSVNIALYALGADSPAERLFRSMRAETSAKQTTAEKTPGFEEQLLRLLLGGGGVTASILLGFALLKKLADLVGNPLEVKLGEYIRDPKYETKAAFLKTFQVDLARLVRTYSEGKKVFVFVDDLDRCEVPKATELMQALNLLISEETPVFYILGVDREKIAAGLAAKYKDLLPYLFTRGLDQMEPNVAGIEFGYSFLEKFIQIPFFLPKPTVDDLDGFLDSLGRQLDSAETRNANQIEVDAGLLVHLSGDSTAVREAVRMVAPSLEFNPRRIKQFLNLFRLRAFLASQTGLFGASKDPTQFDPLTLEQLGKLVGISVRWPMFLGDLEADSQLLTRLQMWVWSGDQSTSAEGVEEHWRRKHGLAELLAFPVTTPHEPSSPQNYDSIYLERYRLDRVDVVRFLRVGRAVHGRDGTSNAARPDYAAEFTESVEPSEKTAFYPQSYEENVEKAQAPRVRRKSATVTREAEIPLRASKKK